MLGLNVTFIIIIAVNLVILLEVAVFVDQFNHACMH